MRSYVDGGEVIELLKELVKYDSVNPSLVPGAKGESEIAEFLAEWMRGLGLNGRVDEVALGRCNAVGILKGEGGGKSLMLNGHTDVVGVDYMTIPPFDPIVKEGKMYGRGTNDMKGGLAASLSALKAVIDSGIQLKGNVVVAAVCDEEYASIGTEAIANKHRVDAAIIGEPTSLQIERCHKGFAWVDIKTRGLAAHGSKWETGIDAITKMGRVLNAIDELDVKLKKVTHPILGPGSVHASIIRGGYELSTYPDNCLLQLERRLIPGEDKASIEQEIERLLSKIADSDPNFSCSYDVTFYRGAMDVPETEEICQLLRQTARDVLGFTPSFTGDAGWLDSQILWELGTPAIAYGPTGGGSHSAVEWVEINSVVNAAKVQEQTIRRFCEVKS